MYEKGEHRIVVGSRLDAGECEQRLDFRCEDKSAGRRGVIERLDSQPIARAEQSPVRAIPDGEAEHAVESGEAGFAPLTVRLEQDLGIGPRSEPVPQRLELRAELAMVIDL